MMVRKSTIAVILAVGGVLSAAACGNAGSDRVLTISTTGLVSGVVFFDANGNRILDAGDTTLAGVNVELREDGSGNRVAAETSDPRGVFRLENIPVGDYRLSVDTTTVGDTVEVARISQTSFSVGPADSVGVDVTVSYPFVSISVLRGLPLGTRVFVVGTALSPLGAFGDTTVHIADSSGALRVTRVRPAVVAIGDSVRLLGRRNVRDGQPTLDDVQAFALSIGILPTAEILTTATAAAADGGRLDAALIRVLDVTIIDTATVLGDRILDVDDGSGLLQVVLSQNAGFLTGALLPDSLLDLTGVLVPQGGGTWQLKPRLMTDIILK